MHLNQYWPFLGLEESKLVLQLAISHYLLAALFVREEKVDITTGILCGTVKAMTVFTDKTVFFLGQWLMTDGTAKHRASSSQSSMP